MRGDVGNMPPLPGVFPDYFAPSPLKSVILCNDLKRLIERQVLDLNLERVVSGNTQHCHSPF